MIVNEMKLRDILCLNRPCFQTQYYPYSTKNEIKCTNTDAELDLIIQKVMRDYNSVAQNCKVVSRVPKAVNIKDGKIH